MYEAKKGKCLVSSHPRDPNMFGPTQTFLKTFGISKSIFRPFLKEFYTFFHKKVCLPTDPKNFEDVTGDKT